jgi:hypothetical protein
MIQMQVFKYKPKMNTGLLNKKLSIYTSNEQFVAEVWGNIIPRTKRRDKEQNEELYDIIIRKNSSVQEYLTINCEGTSYIILTVEDYQKEKGYLFLRCEKSRIHSFYDSCTVKRLVDADKENGATGQILSDVYTQIPCELVRLISGSSNQSEQQKDVLQRFELYLENSYVLKVGDELEIIHKLDIYKTKVTGYFRTHTHQTVEIELESEA